MALGRVQATGKVSGTTAASVTVTFASPPAVGNGVVVPVAGAATGISFATTATCTDNYGNTYTLATTVIQTSGLDTACAIYRCASIATTGVGFAVTVTFNISANYSACAIEVSGVGSGLVLDRTKTAVNSGLTVSTGATAVLSADEELVVALWSTWNSESAITVQAVSPPWTEEYEQLTTNPAVGEADSRILTGVLGTTTSCSWTYTPTNGSWATVLATFMAGAAVTAARVTQTVVETLSYEPRSAMRVGQLLVETLDVIPGSPITATQVAAEILIADANEARVTELCCELIVIPGVIPRVGCPVNFPVS